VPGFVSHDSKVDAAHMELSKVFEIIASSVFSSVSIFSFQFSHQNCPSQIIEIKCAVHTSSRCRLSFRIQMSDFHRWAYLPHCDFGGQNCGGWYTVQSTFKMKSTHWEFYDVCRIKCIQKLDSKYRLKNADQFQNGERSIDEVLCNFWIHLILWYGS